MSAPGKHNGRSQHQPTPEVRQALAEGVRELPRVGIGRGDEDRGVADRAAAAVGKFLERAPLGEAPVGAPAPNEGARP